MRSDKWTDNRDIKRQLHSMKDTGAGGPILHVEHGTGYAYTAEGHTGYLGVSGAGKSRKGGTLAEIRSLSEAGEMFIVVDPKGEIYKATSCYVRNSPHNYDVKVISLRDLLHSDRWNPCDLIQHLYYSEDEQDRYHAGISIDELAHNLYPVKGNDPFWPLSARSLFTGLLYALLDLAKPEQITIHNIYHMLARGEDKYGASTYLKEMVEMMPEDSVASKLLRSYVTTANETRGGIRSLMLEGIAIFSKSRELQEFTSHSDLHIYDLKGDRPIAIYIILPDETPIYDQLAGTLVSQLLNHFIRLAEEVYNGSLPIRLNVCLEELGNIGDSISNLPHLMSAGRSRNIRIQYVLQSLSQLKDIYGESKSTTILSNTDVLVAYRTNHWDTLTELSRKCGERSVTINGNTRTEPLITQSQLGAMEVGQALVMISGRYKYIETFPDYTEIFDCSDWTPPIMIARKEQDPIEIFDIKNWVREKKQQRIQAMSEGRDKDGGGELSLLSSPRENPFPLPDIHVPNSFESSFGSDGIFGNVSLTEQDIDHMIAEIDKKIGELEREEEEEKKKSGKRKKKGSSSKSSKDKDSKDHASN